jgi:phosphatidylinositol alpha-mannosyltransferase
MKVGMVCPYSLHVSGGVQNHVLQLAETLRSRGHEVAVLAPTAAGADVVDVTSGGRSFPVRYNGSIARIAFGADSYGRVRRWLAEHDFDLLHLHEPTAPSLSMLALTLATGPVVATFHTCTPRSRALLAVQPFLRPLLERITARIAVSESARRVQVEHLGLDSAVIGNGVDVARFASAAPLPVDGDPVIGFLGRFDEPRKGMRVLLRAGDRLLDSLPDLRLLVAGRGDVGQLRAAAGKRLAPRIRCLGEVSERDKAAALRSVDLFCAPNSGAESFGMVLTEAMAAGAPVLASDLVAFRRVLGEAGRFFPPGDADALAAAVRGLVADSGERARMSAAGILRAEGFDWPVITEAVLRMYDTAIAASPVLVRA